MSKVNSDITSSSQPETDNKTAKKRVSFDADHEKMAQVVCEIPKCDEMTNDVLNDLYFCREDYSEQRMEAKSTSREADRSGVAKHLDETFSEKNKDAQDRLNTWTTAGSDCRGLERWANRKHGDKRQQDQFNAIMTVLQVQDDLWASKRKVDDEALRKASHKATRAARHFARMMGKADAHVLIQEQNQEKEEDAAAEDDSVTLASTMSMSLNDIPRKSFKACDERSLTDSIDLAKMDELKDSTHNSVRKPRFNFARKRLNKLIAIP